MPWYVAILEDDPLRVAGMLSILAHLLPTARPAVFDAVPPLRRFIADHGHQTVLISLDHDLTRPLVDPAQCTEADRGDGRDACDLLGALPPVCPVIVHSSNYGMAAIMVHHLRDRGWDVAVITPHSDVEYEWIDTDWRAEVERLIQTGAVYFASPTPTRDHAPTRAAHIARYARSTSPANRRPSASADPINRPRSVLRKNRRPSASPANCAAIRT